MAKWNSETTLKFIQEYKTHECLWNFKSVAYKDRNMRDAAYAKLVEAMNLSDFGVAEVKNKIKNLRSTYNQEKKKVEDSKKSGCGLSSVYESNVKWLKELEPTMNIGEKRKTYDNINDEQDTTGEKDANEDHPPSMSSAQVSGEDYKPSRKKKAKGLINVVKDLKELHASINSSEDREEDSFDAFGNSVAKQLRKLSEERGLLAQSAIQNLLTEYGIQDLREKKRSHSRLSYETHSSNVSTPSSYHVSSPLSNSEYQYLPESGGVTFSHTHIPASQSVPARYETPSQVPNNIVPADYNASAANPTDCTDKLASLISASFN